MVPTIRSAFPEITRALPALARHSAIQPAALPGGLTVRPPSPGRWPSAPGPRLPPPPPPPPLAERLRTTEAAIPLVAHQLYAHGAYMGLAKSLLTDVQAAAVLTRLMPRLSGQAVALLAAGNLSAMMLLLENSPVLAAYGAARRGQPLPMEWDIWLDPECPEDMDKARIIHGNGAATLLSALQPTQSAQALLTQSVHGSNAHEGLSPNAWLQLYNEAAKAFGVAKRRPCALYLDIKSGWSTAEQVQVFVDALRRQGLEVRGVGSFTARQLQGVRVSHPLLYVHGPSGVALALRTGALASSGGRSLLNGGALLQHTAAGWQVAPAPLLALRGLQAAGKLQLGIYVQENLVCPEALAALTDLLNREPALFSLGFAYGNVPGVAEASLRDGAGLGWQRVGMASDAMRNMWPCAAPATRHAA